MVHLHGEVDMPNLGMGELIIIFLIVLLIFGASRLPQVGEGIGKAIRGLKRGLNHDDDIQVKEQKALPRDDAASLSESLGTHQHTEAKAGQNS